jgi:hypothetical protein
MKVGPVVALVCEDSGMREALGDLFSEFGFEAFTFASARSLADFPPGVRPALLVLAPSHLAPTQLFEAAACRRHPVCAEARCLLLHTWREPPPPQFWDAFLRVPCDSRQILATARALLDQP